MLSKFYEIIKIDSIRLSVTSSSVYHIITITLIDFIAGNKKRAKPIIPVFLYLRQTIIILDS